MTEDDNAHANANARSEHSVRDHHMTEAIVLTQPSHLQRTRQRQKRSKVQKRRSDVTTHSPLSDHVPSLYVRQGPDKINQEPEGGSLFSKRKLMKAGEQKEKDCCDLLLQLEGPATRRSC